MGMYTELLFKASLKPNIPSPDKEVIDWLFSDDVEWPYNGELPDHPFFECPRWMSVTRCSSYYHHPASVRSKVDSYIFCRADLKNYDDEIAQFFDWIIPFLDESPGQVIGWEWYEEDNEPTLIRMPGELEE